MYCFEIEKEQRTKKHPYKCDTPQHRTIDAAGYHILLVAFDTEYLFNVRRLVGDIVYDWHSRRLRS